MAPREPQQQAVRVEGLAELVKAFGVASREMGGDIRTAIEQAGEPIRQDASQLALSQISGMQRSRIAWWNMRTGVYRGTIGYVAPVQRGVKSRGRDRLRRPRLADRIAAESLEPALERNRDRVFREFDDAVGEMTKAWARV